LLEVLFPRGENFYTDDWCPFLTPFGANNFPLNVFSIDAFGDVEIASP